MAEHPWCFDPSRDEAVRAAEDGREGPLPTLEECIERQKHAAMTAGVKEGFVKADGEWKRLTDDELRQLLVIPKSVSATSAPEQENKGDSMADRAEISRAGQFAPQEARQEPNCTERESVTDRRPPEPGGGGNVTGGLRTERITLEITHDLDALLGDWIVQVIDESLGLNESVRVVDEAATFSAACPIAGGTVKVNGQDMVTLTEFLRHTTKLTQEAGVAKRDRDEAIRERDELRRALLVENDHALRIKDERDAAEAANASWCKAAGIMNARVAELEQARERFDTALEEARTRSGINDFIVQRDEALEELETAIRERDELKARVDYLERDRKFWCLQSGAHEQAANVLRARVAEMESAAKLAPAANADGGSNHAAPAARGAAGTESAEIARLREERRSISTLLGKVETLEADNERLREERRWIPVGERLPEYAEKVLWLWSYGGSFVFPFDGIPPERATHWQPLPPGPEANG